MKYWAIFVALAIICIIIIADSVYGKEAFAFIHALPMGDKLGHLGLMGLLSFSMHYAFPRQIEFMGIQIPLVLLIISILVLGEEISQIWISRRSFSFLDLAADALGIGLGAWLGLWLKKRRTHVTQ